MLRLPPFRYLAPRDVEQAVHMLAQEGEQAMLVAGGTDLYPNMKRRQFTPAGSVSTPPLRNMGTIGGTLLLGTRCNYYNQTEFWRHSIGYCMKKDGDVCLVAPGSPRCWAISSADSAPALVSLGAQVRLVSERGERVLPVRELFRDDGMNPYTMEKDELLTEILLPPADGRRSVYLKLRRRGSFDFPILGVAAALRFNDDETVADARLTLGAVASHPVEANEAVAQLLHRPLSRELIDMVAVSAARSAKPLDNADLTINYRKQVTPVFV